MSSVERRDSTSDSAFEHPVGEFADDDNLMVSATEEGEFTT